MEAVMGIGGWLAQTVIGSLIGTLTSSALENSSALEKCKLDPGMNDALLSLNTSLSKANVILNISPKMEAEADLLKQLKEAVYDAGDVVDDLKYEELKKRVEDQGVLSKKRKRPNDAADKVREVQKRLDEITAAIEKVVTISSAVGEKEPARVREESSSFLLDPEVFGRAEDQKRLTELLLPKQDDGSGSSNNNVSVPIISLVGMGGVGKTTLAQWACSSELGSKFDEKIWICASDPFDVNRLTRDIVQNVDHAKEHSMVTQLDKLQRIVKQQLTSKRFLLVIDDVWNEDRRRWETFYAPLRFGAPGSKILVTTRSHKVVATMNSKIILPLEGLQKDEYYSFFNRCAFGYEDPKKYGRSMEAIGRNIAARLKGLPLAAKTLGSLLNSHLNEDYWRNIGDSEIWNLQQSENDIMPVLKLSFDNLSSRLKPCFAYCSLFPKDYHFQKEIIVQMWMAQDFIVPEANLRMEDVGYRYFDDLFSRCLFEKLPDNNFYPHGDLYVMHDLLHDLAQSISKDECVRLECGGSQDIPSTVRHLSVCVPYSGELNITDVICKHRKLRTLLFASNTYVDDVEFSVDELGDLLSHLTCVRVMVLRGSLKELPDSICKLKQLRYLDIARTILSNYKFPESLCFLYNLQRFRVTPDDLGIYEPMLGMSYPKRMENLVNLREIPKYQFIFEKFICQVADIGRLTCLQELDIFNIKKELGHKIEELQKLTELGGRLRIEHLESIDSKEEAMKAKLKDKKYLRELSLHWASDEDFMRIDESDEQVLEGLQPHPNLKELKIQGYGGIKYPSWLESQLLSNLITIKLIGCKSTEKLPPLGQLQEIIIENCPKLKELPFFPPQVVKLKIIGLEVNELPFLGHLSCLEEICIENCPKLKVLSLLPPTVVKLKIIGLEVNELPFLEELSCLEEIIIENCPKLKELPFFPPQVVKLKIIGLEVNELPFLGHLSCLEEICIENCPKLKVLSLLPPTVVKLELKNVELNEFPPIGHLSCLGEICIENCPKLKVLPSLPPRVVKLELKNVELNEFPPIGHLSGLKILGYGCLLGVRKIEDLFGAGESKGFPSLEEFELVDMPELEEWSGVYGSQFFPCLNKLVIQNCPELRNLPSLPPSLETLRLVKVGLDALLPVSSWVSQESSSSSSSRHNVSLYEVHIESCPNLKSVGEFELVDMPELEEWSGVYGSQFFPCLTKLFIKNCPELRNLPSLPPSLETLRLVKVGLDALPPVSSWVSQESSSSSSRQNASLLEVCIESCPNLKSVEEWLLPNQLPALETISIIDCAELTSLAIERFKDLTCLQHLTLEGCPKLTSAAAQAAGEDNLLFPSSLDSLELGDRGDLERQLLLCLRDATSLTKLIIRGNYRHIISLPGEFFHHLTKLRHWRVEGLTELKTLESLQRFTSLRGLIISDCPQLKALPEDSLPNLNFLALSNCHPDLKEACQKDTGVYWPKIAHIPRIKIDGHFIQDLRL